MEDRHAPRQLHANFSSALLITHYVKPYQIHVSCHTNITHGYKLQKAPIYSYLLPYFNTLFVLG